MTTVAGPARWPHGHVLMCVPVELAIEVDQLITERRLSIEPPPGPSEQDAGAPDGLSGSYATRVGRPGRVWSAEEWRSIIEAKTVSAERITKVLDLLADRSPGERNKTSLDELASKCDMSVEQLKSALSKLSAHINARKATYKDDQWPFAWAYGRDVDPDNPRSFYYWFTPEQHAAWFSAKR
ncbi:MAG TPA: hypothetical protein VNS46_08485 [Nocardioides sp.]|nr:hypothetical protein [Nocardioides sp.]